MSEEGVEALSLADEATDPTIMDPRATIRAVDGSFDESLLPMLRFEGEHAEFERLGVLGAGGMGTVDRVLQRSLDREVAVKQAREPNPRMRTAMMREARIAGRLEHPAIVPIHALGHDESGEAVIVMKKVTGASWFELLQAPDHELWGEADRLLRNLEILTAICRAIELAHARGWLHRDLKTENVMVGEFGEVYVLDWGIAVPIEEAARGEASFGGTPAYMAPEMAAGAALTPQTDVYLLGGMLYEALTGKAPNEAPSPRQMMSKVLIDRSPRRPARTPLELADIVARAMAYHASDRYPSVADFRAALAGFIVHRDALQIAGRAESMVARIDTGESDDPRADLIEARSSFRSALSLWADNPRALQQLDRCLDRLTEHELTGDNPSAAAAWLAERSEPNEELEGRVEATRMALAREAEELEALRDEAAERDLAAWARSRRVRTVVFAVGFTLVGVIGGVLLRAGVWALGFLELSIIHAIFTVATIFSIALSGGRRNAMSRKMGRVMILSTISPFVMMAVAAALGLSAAQSMPLDLVIKAGGTAILGIFVLPVFSPAALVFLIAAAVLLTFPDYPLEITSVGLAVGFIYVAQGLAAVRGRETSDP